MRTLGTVKEPPPEITLAEMRAAGRARSADLLQRLHLQSLNTAAIDGPIKDPLSDLRSMTGCPI